MKPVDYRDIVIEDQADEIVRREEAQRQKTLMIADLWVEVQQWQAFARKEYHARLEVERLRDLAYARLRGQAA